MSNHPHTGTSATLPHDARASKPPARLMPSTAAVKALTLASMFWFAITVFGQWLMVTYLISFYLRAALLGRFEEWNKVLPHGHVPGDTAGNLGVLLHLVFAVLIIVGGTLQLLPIIRRHLPRFHRWNGRIYIGSAIVMSIGGLVMVWTRGGSGGMAQHIAISINALLILACAWMALQHARARRFDAHRRWALRLFLAVSGVWFFRVGLMLWIVIHQGPIGFDPETFRGPFLVFLAFAQYLLPLAILECHLRVQSHGGTRAHVVMTLALTVISLLLSVGIGGAAMMLWLPHM